MTAIHPGLSFKVNLGRWLEKRKEIRKHGKEKRIRPKQYVNNGRRRRSFAKDIST